MTFFRKYQLHIGLFSWILWVTWHRPFPLENGWGKLLVLFALLFLIPLVFEVLDEKGINLFDNFILQPKMVKLPAALSLLAAYFLQQNTWAGILSIPWLLFTVGAAVGGLQLLLRQKRKSTWGESSIAIGMIYLFVGGAWAIFDRFGIRPLGYDAEIVFLTIAHFHYAGFVLPIVAGLAAENINSWFSKAVVVGVNLGVILVAAGIVGTQLGANPLLETLAAWWLALAAIGLALVHVQLAIRPKCNPMLSMLWGPGAVALLAGMVLAGLYGMRHLWAVPGLDIAWMRALHGTANVFGFSLLSVLGWRLHFSQKKSTISPTS